MIPHKPVRLPYGDQVLEVCVRSDTVVVDPPRGQPGGCVETILNTALDAPIDFAKLEAASATSRQVLIAVGDATRDDPRDSLLHAIIPRLPPSCEIAVAIASGTHGPCDIRALNLSQKILDRVTIVNHDGANDKEQRFLFESSFGTRIFLNKVLFEVDFVVATGVIKPHYFAGFSGGVKSIFPGLGSNKSIRQNHRLKTHTSARAGSVTANQCRREMEEVEQMLPCPVFLLNLVRDAENNPIAAVAGSVRHAFREGARLCKPAFQIVSPRSDLVIVSDTGPVTESLYQASKLLAAVTNIVNSPGTVIIVSPCEKGIGPLKTVNEAIYQLGIRPRLPTDHSVYLYSELSATEVQPSYCKHLKSLEELRVHSMRAQQPPVILRHAASALVKPAA